MQAGLLESILLQALESPRGLCVKTSSVPDLKRLLYAARAKLRESGNIRFDSLSLVISPRFPEEELWILKGVPDSEK